MSRISLPHVADVLRQMTPALDAVEFRPVNERYWSLRLGITTNDFTGALQDLRDRRVLERGPQEGNLDTYRLCPDNADAAANQSTNGENESCLRDS